MNTYIDQGTEPPIHRVDPEVERRKIAELRGVKSQRDSGVVRRLLGEIVNALREPFGTYRETPSF